MNQPFEGYYRERAGLIAAELDRWPTATLQEFCQAMETRLGLDSGGALRLVRHLLATKVWRVKVMQPIVDAMPMNAFRHAARSEMRRAQA